MITPWDKSKRKKEKKTEDVIRIRENKLSVFCSNYFVTGSIYNI